ncbi:MAG: hypothetical protein PHQ40_04970, partial [Anaerolineaceae bacterium]|nr:hypothetical protein [Anaerolineaceae bacterium]
WRLPSHRWQRQMLLPLSGGLHPGTLVAKIDQLRLQAFSLPSFGAPVVILDLIEHPIRPVFHLLEQDSQLLDFGWWTADHSPGKVRYVFQYNKDDWSQVNTSVDLDVVGIPNDLMRAEGIVLLQREASQLRANVQKISGGDLGIEECKFYPLLIRYRVTQKIINTGFASSTYTYTYSGAAVNDAAHSTKAANVINNPGTAYASVPYTEFRGHSQITEVGPSIDGDSLETRRYFYQDDLYQGMTYDTQQVKHSSGTKLAETQSWYGSQAQSTDLTIPESVTFQICARKSDTATSCYPDRTVTWIYPTAEESKTFGTDGETYMGTRQEYEYVQADQGNYAPSVFGNLTRTKEMVWTGSGWLAKRATRTLFNPHYVSSTDPNAVVYLVGMPGAQETFACPSGSCTYGIADLAAFSCSAFNAGGCAAWPAAER